MALVLAGLARFDGSQLGPNFWGACCLAEQAKSPTGETVRFKPMRLCRWGLLSAAWLGAVSASIWAMLEFEMRPAAVA